MSPQVPPFTVFVAGLALVVVGATAGAIHWSDSGIRLHVNSSDGGTVPRATVLWSTADDMGNVVPDRPDPAEVPLPPGEHELVVLSQGHETGRLTVQVNESVWHGEETVLQRSGLAFNGTAVSAAGQPLERAVVVAENVDRCGGSLAPPDAELPRRWEKPPSKDVTDSDGAYKVYADTGTVKLTVTRHGETVYQERVSTACEVNQTLDTSVASDEVSGSQTVIPFPGGQATLAVVFGVLAATRLRKTAGG